MEQSSWLLKPSGEKAYSKSSRFHFSACGAMAYQMGKSPERSSNMGRFYIYSKGFFCIPSFSTSMLSIKCSSSDFSVPEATSFVDLASDGCQYTKSRCLNSSFPAGTLPRQPLPCLSLLLPLLFSQRSACNGSIYELGFYSPSRHCFLLWRDLYLNSSGTS